MKKIWIYVFVIIAAAGAFALRPGQPARDNRILATVSNKFITVQDLKDRIAKLPPYYQTIVDKNRKRFLDETVVEMVFYEEAIRRGLDKDREVKEIMEAARKKILAAKLIKTEVEDKIKISDEEAKKFYEEHKDDFKSPELWRASHILVNTEKEAKDIRDEIVLKGLSFEELAKSRSMDGTANRGGDVGYFRMGQVVPEFEKTCAGLKVGEVSDVVHTQFGYHIIKLTDKKESTAEPYEKVKRLIEEELKKKRRSEAFDKFVTALKAKYRVEIKEDVFSTLDTLKGGKEKTAVKK
jgi:peptidyl-prolyl cis-trans isomerase C